MTDITRVRALAAARSQRHYNSSPNVKARKADRQRERAVRQRAITDAIKSVPCVDCGRSFPPAGMDLDHVQGTKLRDVSRMIGRVSDATLMAEIAKCVVRCAVCHRLRR